MTRDLFRMAVGLLVLVVLALSATTFTVREEHTALVTRFGKQVRVVSTPGLHWKLPWPIDAAHAIDGRRRVLDSRHTEMLTRDQRNIVLLSYVVWRVADPSRFFQAVGGAEAAELKLDGLVTNAKIGVLGRYDLSALVSTDASLRKSEEIQSAILAEVAGPARNEYGITVERVGFQRISLPEANTEVALDQMRASRAKFAAEYRAEGEAEAMRIAAEAELAKAERLSEARREAARIRGEGEREAANILAQVHAEDPGLFELLMTLETLEQTVTENTQLLLLTNGSPFQFAEQALEARGSAEEEDE